MSDAIDTTSRGGEKVRESAEEYVDYIVVAANGGIAVEDVVAALAVASLDEVKEAASMDFSLLGYATLRRDGLCHDDLVAAKQLNMDLGQFGGICASGSATPAEAIEAFLLGFTQAEYMRIRLGDTSHRAICAGARAGRSIWDIQVMTKFGASDEEIESLLERGLDPYDYLVELADGGEIGGHLKLLSSVFMDRERSYINARCQGMSHEQARSMVTQGRY